MYVIVGLGNPGTKYSGTRHNVGFDVIDCLADKYGVKINKMKFKSLYNEISLEGEKVIILKPQTYMNNSGQSVKEIKEYFKVPVENIVVVQDDIDLELGKIRIRRKGSAGSHNGLKSIISLLQEDKFPRIKIGVGRPVEGQDLADFVLSGFRREERMAIEQSIEKSAEAVEAIVKHGLDRSMNEYNR